MSIPRPEAPAPPDARSADDRRQRRERAHRLSRRLTRGAIALSAAMVLGFSALAAGVGGQSAATPAGVTAPGSHTQDDTEPGRRAVETAQDSTTEARPERNHDATANTPGEDTGSSSASSPSTPSPTTQAPAVTSGAS